MLIVDTWNGLNAAAPIIGRWTLERSGASFEGEARLCVGYGELQREEHFQVRIGAIAIKRFIEQLRSVEFERAQYQPRIDHTDDIPKIWIELMAGTARVEFFTESQGAFHAPWRLRFGDDEIDFVVSSSAPARALHALRKPLRRDRLKELVANVQ